MIITTAENIHKTNRLLTKPLFELVRARERLVVAADGSGEPMKVQNVFNTEPGNLSVTIIF